MLHIILCIKQVPIQGQAALDPDQGTLQREDGASMMNPDDLHALELALSLREQSSGRITALTMGPPSAEEALREALAFGADRAVLVSDERFAGSDALITGKILSRAIQLLGDCDMVITGLESSDGGTASVSYLLSEYLAIPHLTGIHSIKIADGHAVVERLYGHEYQHINARLPVVAAANREMNRVRHPSLAGINRAYTQKIEHLYMDDIGGTADEYGSVGSPTVVLEYTSFSHKREGQVLEGSPQDKANELSRIMKKRNILRY